ncbi:hypothetical protein BHE74_00030837 [Ensete ventricosum]|nr:hypothetical protein BHE74_00030837 [Ensete ventricosum]
MRRSLGDVTEAPFFLITSNDEKIAMKKSPPHKVLLIRDVVSRFSDHRHLRPLAKNTTNKKSSCHLTVGG